jgi:nitrogen fixation protein NifU and related proteins
MAKSSAKQIEKDEKMDEINQKLLEHFRNPKNVGVIENADGFARVENPVCGDLTDIYIKVENNQIIDVKFKSFGCLVTIASASALSEAVKGKALDEILESKDPVEMLMELIREEFRDIPKQKLHCPPASVQALLTAISDYYKKKEEEKKVKRIEKTLIGIKRYYKA